jgi:hypothetical protein
MVTEAEIWATAKRLCFRACTDCESADECDPDDSWLKEARAALEADGAGSARPSVVRVGDRPGPAGLGPGGFFLLRHYSYQIHSAQPQESSQESA